MSLQSIIRGMEGDAASIWKGFLVKLGSYGSCSRSYRSVVPDESDSAAVADVVAADPNKGRCWANLPPELLRSVLMRIEVSESTWPSRKHVVACAGVCRNWRAITKEIVKTPVVSGKLTFPISLKQPGPRGFLFQCFIKRNRTTKTYHLYLNLTQALNDTGKFLLVARKCKHPTCANYIISLNAVDISKGSSSYVGKLRSNVFGTKFTVYDGMPTHAEETVAKSSTRLGIKQVYPRIPVGKYPVAHIAYEWRKLLCSSCPNRMQCIMDSIPASAMEPGGVAPTQTEFLLSTVDCFPSVSFLWAKISRTLCFFTRPLSGQREGMLVLESKAPMWHEQFQRWTLNFHGRVTVASSKNFQLVASVDNGYSSLENENVLLQFGKVGKDSFTMDYGYPLSAFQAFAICLSTFRR